MREMLEEKLTRFEELEQMMTDPEVLSNSQQMAKNIKTPPPFTASTFPYATLQVNFENIEELFAMQAGETKSFRSSKYQPGSETQFRNANSTYVVRVITITPDEIQLRNDFLRTFLQFSTQPPRDPNQGQIGNGWLQDLHHELGVKWFGDHPQTQR